MVHRTLTQIELLRLPVPQRRSQIMKWPCSIVHVAGQVPEMSNNLKSKGLPFSSTILICCCILFAMVGGRSVTRENISLILLHSVQTWCSTGSVPVAFSYSTSTRHCFFLSTGYAPSRCGFHNLETSGPALRPRSFFSRLVFVSQQL